MRKKSLVTALTTALVVGAASTTFATANPFSDVPRDSWAYDAVMQLVQDGVINGYPDGTFRGQRDITRFEVAQMVAKAMAKTEVSAADKAMIDKLAAEFADELKNLGVRVANLERNADVVKWTGKAEYTIERRHFTKTNAISNNPNINTNVSNNTFLFRLEPSAELNDHWHANARFDASTNFMSDSMAGTGYFDGNNTAARLRRIYVEGDYRNFYVKIGKFPSGVDGNSIFDTNHTGIELGFGKGVVTTLGLVRWNNSDVEYNGGFGGYDYMPSASATGTGNTVYDVNGNPLRTNYLLGNAHWATHSYAALDFPFVNNKGQIGFHYHNVNFNQTNGVKLDSAKIWTVSGWYIFDKNFTVRGVYARSNDWTKKDIGLDLGRNLFSYELDYKGANSANPGTWGAWVGYRYLSSGPGLATTWNVIKTGEKGLEIGGQYVPWKNILATVRFGRGKRLYSPQDVNEIFGRLEFFY